MRSSNGSLHNGKTHLTSGLGIEAIQQGYRVSFVSMGDLVHALKTQEITRKSQIRIKRIVDSDMVIIDDLMFMAMDPRKANLFFYLINQLYDHASIILTFNKGPEEWGELLGGRGITTAICSPTLKLVTEELILRQECRHRFYTALSLGGLHTKV